MALPVRRSSSPPERWDPFRELEELHTRIGQLMESSWPGPGDRAGGIWSPLVDIEETDDAWVVEAELPGVKQEEADRDSALVAAEGAAIESRLTRLQLAASLARSFARLRAAEAETLSGEARGSGAAGPANDAAPERQVANTGVADPTEGRRLRRAS